MATYNMPALSSATPRDDAMVLNVAAAMGAPVPGPGSGSGLGLDAFDPELNFDESMLDTVNGLPNLPFTPSYDFETFTTTFEDPFNYSRPYEAAPDPDAFHDEDSSPQQLDDKLLSFSAPILKASPVDDAVGSFSEATMTAELYGMFFVAEDVFGGDTAGARPMELTCYRRNLWQCSGQITMPRHCTQVVNEQGRAIPIVEFYASITAMESIEGKATEIISIPWKSSNPALGEGQETKTAGPPPKIALDLAGGQEADGQPSHVNIHVAWKRLQFKSATANNGRRKGLQQHYVVQINLLGKMKTGGELMKIAEIQSGPVIVRGRSPRNFDSRKDVPLSGDKKPGSMDRTRQPSENPVATPTLKQERSDFSGNMHRYHALGNMSNNSSDWSGSGTSAYINNNNNNNNTTTTNSSSSHNGHPSASQYPQKRMAVSPNLNKPPVPAWAPDTSIHKTATTSGNLPKSTSSSSNPSLPITLSLSEDERSPNRSASDSLQSPKIHRSSTGQAYGSPTEEAEQLYEYFPLSVDDWTPLVDTVYRPHIVHHIAVPQEIKAQKVRSKAKRYFSAE